MKLEALKAITLLISNLTNIAQDCVPDAKYRTFDGSCNNLKHPNWGRVGTTYLRLHPARYGNNNELPKSVNGTKSLPNVRKLSLNFFPVKDINENVSLAFMQFGQLVAHDTALTTNDNSLKCCVDNDKYYNSDCAPIYIDRNDPFYSQYNVTCLNFVRSINRTSSKGVREQVNSATHMIDGSQIYGTNFERADSLRAKKCGKLKVTAEDDRSFLPYDKNCGSSICYKAGDVRVNQNIDLTILQTLFMREHNRIAEIFCEMNKDWDDEIIYQETRRIIIAILQHIIYSDYLPILLNQDTLKKYNLITTNRHRTRYDENVELMIINSFTTAAFRVLHSGIQGILNLVNYQLDPVKYINITDYIDDTCIIKDNNNFDELILGLITQKMHKIGPSMTPHFNGYFNRRDKPFGNDLTAIDIQRGRDHGLPNYVTMVKLCNNIKINNFDNLSAFIPTNAVKQLEKIYTNVEDIDLFVGGSLEIRVPESHLGPTFECIIGKQFYHLKFGDRYFYDAAHHPYLFTSAQLRNIKTITLARIICDNSDYIERITKNVFLLPSEENPLVDCDYIDGIDLTLWAY